MPSFADSIFLFVLALLLFGPKKLPVLARELGKWMGEFRRASNEFKMQMDEELRASEQADRQKQIAAMQAAAPIPPPLNEPTEPEHPHLRHNVTESTPVTASSPESDGQATPDAPPNRYAEERAATFAVPTSEPASASTATADGARPVPIATSGSLDMMPPATGLPTPRSSRPNALSGLVDAIPAASANGTHSESSASESESVVHGD